MNQLKPNTQQLIIQYTDRFNGYCDMVNLLYLQANIRFYTNLSPQEFLEEYSGFVLRTQHLTNPEEIAPILERFFNELIAKYKGE